MIRIGTRGSKLALAQTEMVVSILSEEFGYDCDMKIIETKGDLDQVSKLSSFRGQGVFTSALERALISNEIDLAVHSLKDLPVQIRSELTVRAYLKRHSPGDTLIINTDKIITKNPLILKPRIRFATGSPRRQSQFMNMFPDSIPIDIRGNIQTRLSKLEEDSIDGLIMATAVFDRISVPIPDNLLRIDFSPRSFVPAPGQAVIAVQSRADEFEELNRIDHEESRLAAQNERKLLLKMGGGCDLSFASYIHKKNDLWNLLVSYAQPDWFPGAELNLSSFRAVGANLDELVADFSQTIKSQVTTQQATDILKEKTILLFRDPIDSFDYHKKLADYGAVVITEPIITYKIKWEQLVNEDLIRDWRSSEWLVISSQRAIPFIDALNRKNPKSHRIAVVGQKTASMVRKYQFPVHMVAEGSMSSLRRVLEDARLRYPGDVLYLHGEDYTSYPSDDSKGFPVYKAQLQELDIGIRPDYAVLFSSRSAQIVLDKLGSDFCDKWVCIGKTTAKTISDQVPNTLVAKSPTPQGILQSIMEDIE